MIFTIPRGKRLFTGIVIVAILLIVVAVTIRLGFDDDNDGDTSPTATVMEVSMVQVVDDSQYVDLSAHYPRVVQLPEDNRINLTLKGLVLEDIAQFEEFARQEAEALETLEKVGAYTINRERSYIEVNEVFVSVALLIEQDVYHGMDGSHWISLTLDIENDKRIEISEMLIYERRSIAIFTQLVILELLKDENACADIFLENIFLNDISSDFNPSLEEADSHNSFNATTHADFALISEGILLAFDEYAIGPGACGSFSTLIRWPAIEERLSEYGHALWKVVAK